MSSELVAVVKSYASEITDFVKSNLGTIAVGAGGVALGAALGAAASSKVSSSAESGNSKRKSRRSKSRVSKKGKHRNNRRRGRRTPRTAGKRKDTSHKRIRYTKKGQPYIILGSGKAKFIKKKGARSAHKRAGGRY